MKYCRYQAEREARYGLVEPVAECDTITRSISAGSVARLPLAADFDAPGGAITRIPLAEARLLPPVLASKIICVGRNYREHAQELGNEVPAEPLIFLKPPSAVIGARQAIVLPAGAGRIDYEGEIAVVIGKPCRNLSSGEDAGDCVGGHTCANDVTARDLQKRDGQWTRAKGFDTFCPLGPAVSDELKLDGGVTLETRVNGQLRQKGNTRDFIFSLDAIIRHVSSVMTLLPGDLILTGTPSGVGPLHAGDRVEIAVSGVGVLSNPVL